AGGARRRAAGHDDGRRRQRRRLYSKLEPHSSMVVDRESPRVPLLRHGGIDEIRRDRRDPAGSTRSGKERHRLTL
ncbi:hypothetical protein Dimus_030780, partial [Dionaea muscipula]